MSKVVKNKNLADFMKHDETKCNKEVTHLPDIKLNYPYGTYGSKDNSEQLPLNRRKARNSKLRTGEDRTDI